MKRYLFLLLAFATQSAFAQDQTTIQKDFQSIVQKTSQNKISEVLDMTYPRLFEVMPKAQMQAMASAAMGGMGMKSIYEPVPLNLKMSKIEKVGAAQICLGAYDQSMRIEFSQPAMMDIMLKTPMQGKVVAKVNDKTISIKGRDYLLAIKDAYTKGTWKYLRYDAESEALNSKVLSKAIIAKADQLKVNLK